MQIKNANDIDKLINDNQYKYVELINREQKKFGGYNATPKDLKNKVTQIKKFLNKNISARRYVYISIHQRYAQFKRNAATNKYTGANYI